MAQPLVLIVEDDPETRHFYGECFARGGFSTREAHNGHQAHGIELCRRLRADARTRSIPVLAITGYEDRQYPDRILAAGADQVLIKPCDPAVLVREVRRLLSK
ncbi:MAG: hypothetical protein DMG01_13805 [Acidobacteria bacterium]|nr:MAG: hypothetical protein DMG01_13805 [Acidobacteriota bacterium]